MNDGELLELQQQNQWIIQTFQLKHNKIENQHFMKLARAQYTAARYQLCIELLQRLFKRLAIVYRSYDDTNMRNKQYDHEQIQCLYLLGECHIRLHNLHHARECMIACIHLGHEAAWQLLVQIECDTRQLKDGVVPSLSDNKEHEEVWKTVRKHMREEIRREEQEQHRRNTKIKAEKQ